MELSGSGASRFFVAAKLTIKQEKFARKYVATGNASEAYRHAYKTGNMTAPVIHKEACLLLQNPKVSVMVDELKAQHSDFQDITFEEIGGYLRRAVDGATAAGQHGAASQAAVALGKLAGLYVEKQKVSVDGAREHLDAVQTLADEPDDDEPEQKVVNFR